MDLWPLLRYVPFVGKHRPQLYADDRNTWKVTDEARYLPVGQYVRVSIPTPGRKGNGSRLIYVAEHSESFVDRATGKEMVVVCGPTRDRSPITARPLNHVKVGDRAALTAHQRATRGACGSCGRVARLVDGTCRPCLRVAS